MNKLMYRFVTTRKKKKKKEIDPFLDTVCPLRASRVKRNRPVLRHGMPPQGIPRNKMPATLALRVMLGLIHLFQLYASPIDKSVLANGIV